MAYELGRLGWLQFQQLCSQLLAIEAGVAPSAWNGSADDSRIVRVDADLGPPLVGYPLPGPVLVQCVWARPELRVPIVLAAERMAREYPEELPGLGSYLLISNAELVPELHEAQAAGPISVGVLGTAELSARIDALAELREAMPSLLGLGEPARLIAPERAARSSVELVGAEELARVFVPTDAYAQALAALRAHHFTVLTGPPEMGKTAIARMLGLAKMTCGWEAHECTTPAEVAARFDRSVGQLFIADDAFGCTEYRADLAERWARELERLLRAMDERHWLVWTSRPAPLHAALRRLHRERGAERFPAPARVLVDAATLDPAEKTLILFRHAKAAGLPRRVTDSLRMHGREIVSNRHFTPERIRRLIGELSARPDGVDVGAAVQRQLTTATEAMSTSFGTLAAEHRDLLVAMLDSAPGPVPERELTAALRRHHEGLLTHPPAELVDRLADHFVRVIA
jgi:Novel STAND NTPase 3